ncbi:MAG: rod shape-determining protein MreC [Bdellovibrionales bacterium]|nr:rod shape-determining protein MreC [Bdellovibrionales bacterium]
MNFFRFDLKKLFIFALLILLPVFSLSLLKPGDRLWIFRPLGSVTGFVQSLFVSFSKTIQDTTGKYLYLVDINKEIADLKSENAKLKAEVMRFTEIEKENTRLNTILQFTQDADMKLISAQVIGIDIFAERASIRINRGTRDGVEKGQAVITKEAAVGYILEASETTSLILVLTDRYAVIDAIIQNSRARGIVEGSGPDSCLLKYLQRSDEVQIGDVVVTSGLDNIFPKGLPIARVKNVSRRKSEISPTIELMPMVDVSRLDEVFVVHTVINATTEASIQ